jgi:choline kinase
VTTVVISAAGLGTRLGMNMPKCLLPLHEGRLIDYQLALLPPGADVRIVVGFKETEVIDHVCRHWPDVTFVRNPNFATTSNSYSLHLATRWLKKPFIAIDGDLLIDPVAFRRFWDYCQTADPPTTIGIVPRASEEAVGVARDGAGLVTRFLRPDDGGYAASTHEWCGIAYFNGLSVEPNQKYVFEELARYLPLPSFEIRCCEIDTPKDLEHAMQVFSSMTQPLPWMRATA